MVYLHSGDMLEAEGSRQRSSDPFQWVYYGYGGSMYQQVSNAGTEYKHWNLRGDLVEASCFVQIVNLCTIYGGE